MTYDDLISHYRTQTEAGAALAPLRGKAVAQSTVAGWKKEGIPEPVQAQYEIVTRGKLRADRPKINGHKREVRVA
jgi:hypothetical protein